MSSQPITTFTLYAVPFDRKLENVTDFASASERDAYFATLPKLTFTNAQYIRKNSTYNVPAKFDVVENYNYIVYDNGEGQGKEFAFITEKKFQNFDVTTITMEADPWQNNLFKYSIVNAYVEREHANRYTSGGVPNFPRFADFPFEGRNKTLTGTAWHTTDTVFVGVVLNEPATADGKFQYGQPFIVGYIPVNLNDVTQEIQGASSIMVIPHIMNDPKVLNIFLTPMAPFTIGSTIQIDTFSLGEPAYSVKLVTGFEVQSDNIIEHADTVTVNRGDVNVANINANNPRSMQYEPALLQYPYNYYKVELAGSGSFIVEKPDLATSDTLELLFKMSGGIDGAHIMARAGNNTLTTDPTGQDHKVISETNPSFALSTDQYLQYEQQNRASMNGGLVVGALLAAAGVGLGVATGGVGLAVAGGAALSQVGTVGNELLKRGDLRNAPDTVRAASNSGLGEWATEFLGGICRVWEYDLFEVEKERLFDFFTKYGWKVGRVKAPNLRTRTWYNYVKTVGASVNGVFCTDEREALERMFDNGVTIWHYRNGTVKQYGDYTLENKEVTF